MFYLDVKEYLQRQKKLINKNKNKFFKLVAKKALKF